MTGERYDRIGRNYSEFRGEDPDLKTAIDDALGDCRAIVNIGAGAGSYEPSDREVVPVEPSAVMRSQHPRGWAAVDALARDLPFGEGSFDAAMSVLSVHHWEPDQRAGVTEMRRVARERVVIVTVDARVSNAMWLADYLPEVADLDARRFPAPDLIAEWLGGDAEVQTLPVCRDTPDWMMLSYWAHPERLLDPIARRATSGLSRLDESTVERAVGAVRRDLRSGEWDRRYGELRTLSHFDAGLRLIAASGRELASPAALDQVPPRRFLTGTEVGVVAAEERLERDERRVGGVEQGRVGVAGDLR